MTHTGNGAGLNAGWYFDPENAQQLRWFDGSIWTEHFSLLPPPPVDSGFDGPNPFTDSFVIKAAVPAGRSWHAEHGVAQYVPAVVELGADEEVETEVTGSDWTVEIWILAALPLIAFAAQWSIARFFPEVFLGSPWTFWIAPVVLVLLGPLAAASDRQSLSSRGIDEAPSPLAGIVPPVYLLLRALVHGASGVVPLLIWCVSVVALYVPTEQLVAGFLERVAAATVP